jgi:hypothetical protein
MCLRPKSVPRRPATRYPRVPRAGCERPSRARLDSGFGHRPRPGSGTARCVWPTQCHEAEGRHARSDFGHGRAMQREGYVVSAGFPQHPSGAGHRAPRSCASHPSEVACDLTHGGGKPTLRLLPNGARAEPVTSHLQVTDRPHSPIRAVPSRAVQEVVQDGSESGVGREPNRTRCPSAVAFLQSRIPQSRFARCRNIRRQGRSGRHELVTPLVPRAAAAVSISGPTRHSNARQGRDTGRQDAAAATGHERASDRPRNGPQARQRRAPPVRKQQRPQGTPQGST